MRLRAALIGVELAVLTVIALAQASADRLAFEVASVRPNRLGSTSLQRMTNLPPGDRVSFTNVTARNLIQVAYAGFSDIIGAPDWMGGGPLSPNQERFDVNAKAGSFSTHLQLQEMLRALLADRFKLALHDESRIRPVYALVFARGDGRFGPNLKTSARDCATLRAEASAQGVSADPCMATGRGLMVARAAQLDGLAGWLQTALDRPVVNKTGLTGDYDWDFSFSFDPDNGASMFTALQEQLGLKLVPQNDEQPILVIDHIERPTED